jgi:hypothetical protein
MKNKGKIPEIQVGILSGNEITFTLNSAFYKNDDHSLMEGKWSVIRSGNHLI